MNDQIISRKYATALFNAALKENAIDPVADDMAALGDLISHDGRFVKYLESPQVPTDHKRSVLKSAFENRISPVSYRFLRLVLDKKRVNYLPGMAAELQELVRQHKGIVRAQVTTAVPLERDQADRIAGELGRITGKTVQIDSRVDPLLLGGVIVAYENQIIDRSVRRGLDDLRETLMKVRVL
jgi:F-type H+-transporting ATPase subunit delta